MIERLINMADIMKPKPKSIADLMKAFAAPAAPAANTSNSAPASLNINQDAGYSQTNAYNPNINWGYNAALPMAQPVSNYQQQQQTVIADDEDNKEKESRQNRRRNQPYTEQPQQPNIMENVGNAIGNAINGIMGVQTAYAMSDQPATDEESARVTPNQQENAARLEQERQANQQRIEEEGFPIEQFLNELGSAASDRYYGVPDEYRPDRNSGGNDLSLSSAIEQVANDQSSESEQSANGSGVNNNNQQSEPSSEEAENTTTPEEQDLYERALDAVLTHRTMRSEFYDWRNNTEEGRQWAEAHPEYAGDDGYEALRVYGSDDDWFDLLGWRDLQGIDGWNARVRNSGVDVSDPGTREQNWRQYFRYDNPLLLDNYRLDQSSPISNRGELDTAQAMLNYITSNPDIGYRFEGMDDAGVNNNDIIAWAIGNGIINDPGSLSSKNLATLNEIFKASGEGGTFELVDANSDDYKLNRGRESSTRYNPTLWENEFQTYDRQPDHLIDTDLTGAIMQAYNQYMESNGSNQRLILRNPNGVPYSASSQAAALPSLSASGSTQTMQIPQVDANGQITGYTNFEVPQNATWI